MTLSNLMLYLSMIWCLLVVFS